MTDNDFHAARTELANTFAQAGAELLDFMGSAGALAAIPNTAQYVVAGDPAAIRAQLDTVNPQRRMRHGQRPEHVLYWPETGQPRRWAALITSAGHGILQEYGSKFEHAQPGQEVLEVAEILPGSVGASTVLTDERMPFAHVRYRSVQRLTTEGGADAYEWYEFCEPREIGDDKLPAFPVYDQPVAAQAGQVAVPVEGQVTWSIDLQARLIALGVDQSDDVRNVMAEAACLLASLTGAQASTAGGRQEGGGRG